MFNVNETHLPTQESILSRKNNKPFIRPEIDTSKLPSVRHEVDTSKLPSVRHEVDTSKLPSVRHEVEFNKIPNINNQEHSWVSITGVTDNIDPSKVIDNNEMYTEEAMQNINSAYNVKPKPVVAKTSGEDDLYKIFSSLDEEDYMLLIDGVPVCAGELLEVQEQAEKFVSGTHKMSFNQPIDVDSIMVLKKVKIKFGLFLES